MPKSMYDIIKKQHGEHYAQTLRTYHNGIFDIPELDKVLQYAGNNADDIKFFLVGLLKNTQSAKNINKSPIELLDEAGYNAYYADTLEKQNAISKYFAKGEELCTFRDATRFKNYYIINAVKKNVDQIKRKSFHPEREDDYGTSVISIQILKTGGFISIKNRYNHTVENPDNTFNSNPDNIITGLSAALKNYFKVDFNTSRIKLPKNYLFLKNQIVKYNYECENIYMGNSFYVKNGVIYSINKDSQIICDMCIIDMKEKKVIPLLDPHVYNDPFSDVIEAEIKGKKLRVAKNANGGHILFANNVPIIKTTAKGALEELHLETTTHIGDGFRSSLYSDNLQKITAPNIISIGNTFCAKAIGNMFCETTYKLAVCMENLRSVGNDFLSNNTLSEICFPALEIAGNRCLCNTRAKKVLFDKLQSVGDDFLYINTIQEAFFPELKKTGNHFMKKSCALRKGIFPQLQEVGYDFLNYNAVDEISFAELKKTSSCFMEHSKFLKKITFDKLKQGGGRLLLDAPCLEQLIAPNMKNVEQHFPCFKESKNLKGTYKKTFRQKTGLHLFKTLSCFFTKKNERSYQS